MVEIQVKNLTKVFGRRPSSVIPLLKAGKNRQDIYDQTKHLVALNQVNFSVEKGKILVIIGLSGSGKSTLLRCINRLIEPTSGSILVNGQDITNISPRKLRKLRQDTFGMVFQHFALLPHYSVLRNTAFGLELAGHSKKHCTDKAMEALTLVGLEDWADKKTQALSGGMQQRVGLARALALDPEVLLMDEAFSALDPLNRRKMQDELLRIQRELGKTIIFISHDLDEAITLGDHIILLNDGEILQEGTAEDILANPANEHVANFVQDANMGKVLTSGSIMIPASAVAILGIDGPHTIMRKVLNNKISSIFVVDVNKTLLGVVTVEDVLKLKRQHSRDISSIINTNICCTDTSASISSIVGLMASLPYPLPVVDEQKRLRGVIIRGILLEALNGDYQDIPNHKEQAENGEEEQTDNAQIIETSINGGKWL